MMAVLPLLLALVGCSPTNPEPPTVPDVPLPSRPLPTRPVPPEAPRPAGEADDEVPRMHVPAPQAAPPEAAGEGTSDADAAAVRKVVDANRGPVKFCFDRELKSDPRLKGRVDVTFRVDGGKAGDVRVSRNTTGNDDLADCVVHRVAAMQFPADVDTTVTYPFRFSAP